MKKIASMILAIVFMISMASVASAGTKIVTGTASGTAGSTSCTGELHYYNSSNPGEDYAYAETASIKSGKVSASATIYYNNGRSTVKPAVKEGATSVTTAKAYAGDGYQATKAVGSHIYSSSQYGSWNKSQTYYY